MTMLDAIVLLVAYTLVFGGGIAFGVFLERAHWPRRYPPVSGPQPMPNGTPVKLPEKRPETDESFVAKERTRILQKLDENFPDIGSSAREKAADEILEKAKATLGRLR